ncbi:MAG: hypothetical protein AB1898_30805 [Acidobacteriota bacterium]
MKKPAKVSSTRPAKWTSLLDPKQVRQAFEEAVVDCYGDYEQHTGLLTMIEDEVTFPFEVSVLGETVQVVKMDWPDDDTFGLDLVCERNGSRYRIDARSVDLLPPFPNGHLYLAAYLEWRKHL